MLFVGVGFILINVVLGCLDVDCSLNGKCESNKCVCYSGWKGPACDVLNLAKSFVLYGNDTTSSWGTSVIKNDGVYFAFVSEFVRGCSLQQWSPNSRIIRYYSISSFLFYFSLNRLSSRFLTGPYSFDMEVLPPFHHNPTVVKYGEKFLLYCIGINVNTTINCNIGLPGPSPGNYESNVTMFVSSDMKNWKDYGEVLKGRRKGFWDSDTTNPSACVDDDRVWLMYRGCPWKCPGNEKIGLAVASSFDSLYTRVNNGPLFEFQAEDPFIWKDLRGNFHALLHAIDGNGGFHCDPKNHSGCDVGRHAFSSNGLNWTVSKNPAYSTHIEWTDGTVEILNRRERPQLVFDDERNPIMLINGAQGKVPTQCNEKASPKTLKCPSYTIGKLCFL